MADDSARTQVHRCRFVEWQPAGVTAMARGPDGRSLAVARASGVIEVWEWGAGGNFASKSSAARRWVVRETFYGAAASPANALLWVSDRLFSADTNGVISEWASGSMAPVAVHESHGGAVWDLASSPEGTSIRGATLLIAAACDDGALRLFDASDGELNYFKTFPRQDSRLLSVDWHADGAYLFTGSAKGAVQRWSVKTGRTDLAMQADAVSDEDVQIWAIAVLSDMTVVSGDSGGQVTVWDGVNGTVVRLFTRHREAVLALAVSKAEDVVCAAGNDQTVTVYRKERVTRGTSSGADGAASAGGDERAAETSATGAVRSDSADAWVYSLKHHGHSHDVSAMAMVELGDNAVEHVITAGVDTKLVAYDVYSGRTSTVAIMPYPTQSLFSFCSATRMMVARLDNTLQLWRLGQADDDVAGPAGAPGSNQPPQQPQQQQPQQPQQRLPIADDADFVHLLQLGDFNLAAADISPDGQFVAYSTAEKTAVLRLIDSPDAAVDVEPVDFPQAASGASVALRFLPDASALLVCRPNGELLRVDLVDHLVARASVFYGSEAAGEGASLLAVADDGNMAAVVSRRNGSVAFVSLPSVEVHSVFSFEVAVVQAVFVPGSEVLALTTVDNRLLAFDPADGKLTHTIGLAKTNAVFFGIAFNPSRPDDVYYHNTDTIVRTSMAAASGRQGGKRKAKKKGHKKRGSPAETVVVDRYRPLLYCDFVAAGEMVVVERPWGHIADALPEALKRHKYGT